MAEVLDLNTPITKPSTTTWRVVGLNLSYEPNHSTVGVHLLGSDGLRRSYGYTDYDENQVFTGTATALLSALNTANLSVKSLQKRVLERIAADFPVNAGTVSGTPD